MRVALTLFLFLSVSVSATTLFSLDFNADGVLPSSQGFNYTSSGGIPEADLYTAAGGVLEQRTTSEDLGNHSYTWTGTLDSSLRTILEARLDVLQLNVGSAEQSGGVYFQALDGAYRYGVSFEATGVRMLNNVGGVDVFVLDYTGFHTYRLVSDGGSGVVAFYFDGGFVANVNAQVNAANLSNFGDGVSSSGNNGDANWDYIFLQQEDNAVPEPSSWLLMATSMGAVAWKRVRNRPSRPATSTAH